MTSRRLLGAIWIIVSVAACSSPAPFPAANFDSTGILLVQVGEKVQAIPANEAMAQAHSDALVLAESNGDDLGYPWIDPSNGQLVLSAATQHGRDLIQAAGISVPHRIRDVAHGAAELTFIQDDVTVLRTRGVAGAELIYMTVPDHRDNRAMIVISAMSRPLLEYLAGHYGADALAVQVNPAGGASG